MKQNNPKSPWRFVFLAGAVLSGLWLLLTRLVLWLLPMTRVSGNAASIGIIGGADGPTAIFLTGPGFDWEPLAAGLVFIGCIVAYIRMGKSRSES